MSTLGPLTPWDASAFGWCVFATCEGRGVVESGGWPGFLRWVDGWHDHLYYKATTQNVCFAQLADGRRRGTDVLAVTALAFDCDSGHDPMPLLDAVEASGAAFAYWETKRHAPESPRWRLVLPLARPFPVEGGKTESFARLWRGAAAMLVSSGSLPENAFDLAGATPNHLWLPPVRLDQDAPSRAVRTRADGLALDWPLVLAVLPPEAAPPPPAARTTPVAWGEFSDDLRAQLIDQLAAAWPGDGLRHEAMLALAHVLVAHGVPGDEVARVVFDAATAAGDPEPVDRRTAATSALLGNPPRRRGFPWLRDNCADLAQAIDRVFPMPAPAASAGDADDAANSPDGLSLDERDTDKGNADRLVALYGQDLLHDGDQWYAWDGRRFAPDIRDRVVEFTKAVLEQNVRAAAGIEDPKVRDKALGAARRCLQGPRVRSVVTLAASCPGVRVVPDDLDADRDLLNVVNGTVDLRAGTLRAHDRTDRITKLAPVAFDPDATCPRFLSFLDFIMRGDRSIVDYLQRFAGSCASGDIREHVFHVWHGDGANGKGTLIRMFLRILGDYACQASTDTFLVTDRKDSGASHKEDQARLHGIRFVAAEEVNQGRQLDMGRVKTMTGGDRIVARMPYGKRSMEFTPEFTLTLAVNALPHVPTSDHGTWRRLRCVPFAATVTDEMRDNEPDFERVLAAEDSGILAWMVRGCLEWRRQGLCPPPTVIAATDRYRGDTDPVQRFLAEQCAVAQPDAPHDPAFRTDAAGLYQAYAEWCGANDVVPVDQHAFGTRLTSRGIPRKRTTGGRWFRVGIRLVPASDVVTYSDVVPDNFPMYAGTRACAHMESFPESTSLNVTTSLPEDAHRDDANALDGDWPDAPDASEGG